MYRIFHKHLYIFIWGFSENQCSLGARFRGYTSSPKSSESSISGTIFGWDQGHRLDLDHFAAHYPADVNKNNAFPFGKKIYT